MGTLDPTRFEYFFLGNLVEDLKIHLSERAKTNWTKVPYFLLLCNCFLTFLTYNRSFAFNFKFRVEEQHL